MRRVLTLVAALVVFLPFLAARSFATHDGSEAICDTAAVIFCDNFENRATGSGDLARAIFKNAGWDSINPTTEIIVISSSTVPQGVFNGTRALQFQYPVTSSGDNGGTGNATTFWPGGGSHRTLFHRWYVKHSADWLFSPIATKHYQTLGLANSPFFFHGSGTGVMVAASAPVHFFYSAGGVGTNFDQNINGVVDFVPNQWFCVEARLTWNTASGASDGYLQGWIDGVQHWEFPNVNLDNTGPNPQTSGFQFDGYWNCNNTDCATAGNNHPEMERWHDNSVVSTQRIGCLGGSPPSPPANFRITMASLLKELWGMWR